MLIVNDNPYIKMMIHHKFAFGRKSYCDELYFRITFYYRGEGFLGEYQKSAR